MHWIPWAVWGGAVVAAVVILGFCGYEIRWKADRLRADLARLRTAQARLQDMRAELSDASERLLRSAAAVRGEPVGDPR